ncbi:hypothetical protein DZB84_23005 [Bacillus sp. HNG]|uniref:hypothetical protein n=1 Tax=Bacillus sp. HNG TaxID=2293325 RepID=UPI000E2F2175|nr:hypothetical protein [Bacillus sp. HNG]RFB10239.1 hypothetical protein DZB84_23005 [Bacillus sp. HNG]
MTLNMFVDIVKMTINEIKVCKQKSRSAGSKIEKTKYLTLVYVNILFLPVYLIPVLYSIAIIIGSFIYVQLFY